MNGVPLLGEHRTFCRFGTFQNVRANSGTALITLSGIAKASETLLPVVPAGTFAPAFAAVTAEAPAVSPESAPVTVVPRSAVTVAESSIAAGIARSSGIFRSPLVFTDINLSLIHI